MRNLFRKPALISQLLKLTNFYYTATTTPKELCLKESDKCLLLTPHQDDESIGCGGLLLKHSENFEIICLTDGRLGADFAPDENIKIRKDEFISAMKYLNIDNYSFLDIEDRKLINNYETFKQLDISQYDYIFIPNNLDQHADHKAVTALLQKLIKKTKHKNNVKVVMYEVWATLGLPNFYTDITNVTHRKKELIANYKTQLESIDYDERIIALNKYRGMARGVGFAESFTVLDKSTFLKL